MCQLVLLLLHLMQLLRCCFKPGCKHPCLEGKQPSTPDRWYPGGPPLTHLPLPKADPSRPCGWSCSMVMLKFWELLWTNSHILFQTKNDIRLVNLISALINGDVLIISACKVLRMLIFNDSSSWQAEQNSFPAEAVIIPVNSCLLRHLVSVTWAASASAALPQF